ncbi:hypothetical protein EC912_102614 [Luteibacter rhizovicinus]|uniref:Polymer-forming cytoskeletal protein n=1 Tax=Luteibacter rhizovicinus TaxID=242606 RepID=A0A4R3YXS3_9GAMM|nr:hypothetical protein [Luteibacter rhizovicinus]TCV96264.1 hypothetical protein EC912_102614 [Luteibacter rhizovicinus]
MRRQLLSLVIALSFAGAAVASDTEKVNGAVRIPAGQHVEDVSTVNGAVEIGAGATAQKASTVNGSITIGDNASARELETVNGAITLGTKAQIASTVEAVNGGIRLAQGADVKGKTSNVNGSIVLDAAHVGGGIETVAGDIDVGANSRVEGGILVKKPGGWFNFNSSHNRPPRIVIGPNAIVQGTLQFDREVELYVSDKATVGAIKGATPAKFSGATP